MAAERTWRLACLLAGLAANLGVGLAFGPGRAEPAPPASTPAPTSPQTTRLTLRLDPARTHLAFSVRVLGIGVYHGVFEDARGEIDLDPKDPERLHIRVTAPTNRVTTPNPMITRALTGPNWLDVARYPEMRFEANRLTRPAPDRLRVEGKLTLHGVTHPLVLEGRLDPAAHGDLERGLALGLTAHGDLRRSAYGLLAYRPLIGDDLQVSLDAAFVRGPAGSGPAIAP
ncbi:MAG: YceI family protein [Alphaproteobacteria bacterium]|nr:YceI family protein [Alphaproteobacteria bacterium]